ncbi:MAG TPA: hypothetical protein DC054_02020 [Blastocatellia bacterium]|nr:hypothetical protein [Blastocatellia bacterium]
MKKSRSADELLKSYPSDVQVLAGKARQLLLKLLPGVEERADSSVPLLSYAYGPGYPGMVCTLILSKSGVKLGLVRGVELADPKGLLEGSGKVHKYVQLRKASDLNRPGVKGLVKAAHAAWQQRNA